ncbi:MAG TPA: DUF4191 domain-containing protein [Mycobacteriales bacterium]|jgi:hypothetical protein
MAATPDKVSMRDRAKQFGFAFSYTRRNDPRFLPYFAAAVLVPLVVAVVAAVVTGRWALALPVGILVALIAGMFVFGRRTTAAMYNEIAGQPGAAAQVLQTMRGDWRVTPAVQVSAQQDLVHRVIGRPGVVLVAEGTSSRLKGLLGQEMKRVRRVTGGIETYVVVVGEGEDEVSLKKLQTHFLKLPRNITPKQVNALDTRLRAMSGPNIPMPKGPLPKGARLPKGAKLPRG